MPASSARAAEEHDEASLCREEVAFGADALPWESRAQLDLRVQRLDRLGALALALVSLSGEPSPAVWALAAAAWLAPPAAYARRRTALIVAVDLALAATLALRGPGFTPPRLRRPPSAVAAADSLRFWMGTRSAFLLAAPLLLPVGSPTLHALLHLANQFLLASPAVCASPLARGRARSIASLHGSLALLAAPMLEAGDVQSLVPAGEQARCEALVAFMQSVGGLVLAPCALARLAHPALRLAVRRRGRLGALDARLADALRRGGGGGLLGFYCALTILFVLSCLYAAGA